MKVGLPFLILVFVCGTFLGNCSGDRQTFEDCARTGKAKMVGSGEIICEIKKDEKK